ncbi:MAG: hypothetical protein Q9162_003905 [Coniocarpon cinnabarinum]
MASTELFDPPTPSSIDEDLPSPSTSSSSSTVSNPDNIESDADREWRESLQQLELLLTMVLVPYVGKYFGRKFAYWAWGKWMTWMYPVQIEVTDPALFKSTGAVGAAVAAPAL